MLRSILLLLTWIGLSSCQSVVTLLIDKDTVILENHPDANGGDNEILQVSASVRTLLNFDIDQWDLEKDITRAMLNLKVDISGEDGKLIIAPLHESFMEGDGINLPDIWTDFGDDNLLYGSTWNCWISDDDVTNSEPDCDQTQQADERGGGFSLSQGITVDFEKDDRSIDIDITEHVRDGIEEWILLYPDGQGGKIEMDSEEVPPFDKGPTITLEVYDQAYLFNDEVKEWNMIIEEEDLEFLLEDPEREEYVPCSIKLEGRPRFEGIGCRFKGDASNLHHCLDGVDLPIPDPWTHNCRTLHWQMDSNYFRDDKQRFHGLKKLQFHGFNENMNYISEGLAYGMWKEAGVAASRTSYVTFKINGQQSHLMMLVEEVDDIFTKDRFSYDLNEGKGSLYKEPWPNALEANFYDKWQLEDGPENGDFWVEIARYAEANQDVPRNEEEARALLEPYFELDTVDVHQAIVTILNHGSTVNAVICRPCRSPMRDLDNNVVQSLSNDCRYRHNYFFYVEETEEFGKRLKLVPWDFDSTMSDSRISILESPHWTLLPDEPNADCNISESGTRFLSSCDPAGFLWSLGTRGAFVENFRHYAQIFSVEWFKNKVAEVRRKLRPYVEVDMLTPDVQDWEDRVDFWLEYYLGPKLDGVGGSREIITNFIENDVADRIAGRNDRSRSPQDSPSESDSDSEFEYQCIPLSGRPAGTSFRRVAGLNDTGECCDVCLSETECSAWMWHQMAKKCHLLSAVDEIHCSNGWQYNLKDVCSPASFDTNRLEGDRIQGLPEVTTGTDVGCCVKCLEESRCAGWSFSEGECVLRGSLDENQDASPSIWVSSIIRVC